MKNVTNTINEELISLLNRELLQKQKKGERQVKINTMFHLSGQQRLKIPVPSIPLTTHGKKQAKDVGKANHYLLFYEQCFAGLLSSI